VNQKNKCGGRWVGNKSVWQEAIRFLGGLWDVAMQQIHKSIPTFLQEAKFFVAWTCLGNKIV
jgi:hypothetical protein